MIPIPVSQTLRNGSFQIRPETVVGFSPDRPASEQAARAFARSISKATGWEFEPTPMVGPGHGAIVFTQAVHDPELGDEGYTLTIGSDGVVADAPTYAGLFYAAQTMLALLPGDVMGSGYQGDLVLPAMEVRDWPRFSWRESMLDGARHMQSVEYIKRHLDLMAFLKLNRFHWHLTEDQGWRPEIKAFPGLTEIGAWRQEKDGTTYGGFYTQDEMREVVVYAKERHIEVVPEFEMPGHSLAALAAYPELSCTGGPFKPTHEWGVFDDIYCAGNDQVFEFIQRVLDELLEIFPYEYVHIGGDEAPKVRWQNCPKCQARIQAEGLANENELQSWFIRKVEAYLAKKGRKLIGWDEIHEGGLPQTATVQWWRGWEKAIAVDAAQRGHAVISTPTSHCYLDYKYDEFPVELVYGYDAVPEGLDPAAAKSIIGGGGNMWTERTPTEADMDRMIWPRMAAIAEALWSPAEKRSWEGFSERLPKLQAVFNAMDVNAYTGR